MLSLHHRLQACAVRPTIEDLAQQLNVTTRTVYRDLALLEECHIPVPPRQREVLDAQLLSLSV